ncbi:MAG: hypothetical protein IPJ60_01450 [Sphingobacteriaceae bacterium]|nr:hypothetical protein [Sphingobacteriaceae bacterium]
MFDWIEEPYENQINDELKEMSNKLKLYFKKDNLDFSDELIWLHYRDIKTEKRMSKEAFIKHCYLSIKANSKFSNHKAGCITGCLMVILGYPSSKKQEKFEQLNQKLIGL